VPVTDLIVLIVVGITTSTSAIVLWRRGIGGREMGTAIWLSFYGMVLIAMMTAHNLEILYRTISTSVGVADSASSYTFRVYSMLLFGALLTGAGVVCLRSIPGVIRGSKKARDTSARASVFVLAIVVPVIPIQMLFGILLTGLSVLSVMVLMRRSRTSEAAARSGEAKRPFLQSRPEY
jgi:hypothetical protein